MTGNRAEFLRRYEEELKARFSWAQDRSKLHRFMVSVRTTVSGEDNSWLHSGEAVTAVWQAMGNKGKPTLKALRAL
mgnify:CR=1 FL=1